MQPSRRIRRQAPCWRRYNHDGYGQRPDGGPYVQWGQGRSWPLLTGERAHYELAAGHDCLPLLHAMEQFSNGTCLLPEQIWDDADLPGAHLRCGGPTGSANPLLWAHSEYVRLLRSRHDGKVFDLIPEVVARFRDEQDEKQSGSSGCQSTRFARPGRTTHFAFARRNRSAFAGPPTTGRHGRIAILARRVSAANISTWPRPISNHRSNSRSFGRARSVGRPKSSWYERSRREARMENSNQEKSL